MGGNQPKICHHIKDFLYKHNYAQGEPKVIRCMVCATICDVGQLLLSHPNNSVNSSPICIFFANKISLC